MNIEIFHEETVMVVILIIALTDHTQPSSDLMTLANLAPKSIPSSSLWQLQTHETKHVAKGQILVLLNVMITTLRMEMVVMNIVISKLTGNVRMAQKHNQINELV